jgi:hypothetical protein
LIAPSHSVGALLAASSAAAAACAISTDTDCGSFEGVCKRDDCGRRAFADTRHQQFGLPLEELQDFLFEAGIVEGYARQVRAIEHGISVRRAVTIDKADCALDHLGLPRALFVLGTLT